MQRKRPSIVSLKIAGLLTGAHAFSFELSPSFFERREHTLVKDGRYTLELVLHKHDVSMSLDVEFQGSVAVICDLCSETEPLKTSGAESFVLKAAGEHMSDDENIVHYDPAAPEIDLDDLIYDLIVLSVPLRRLPCANEDDDPTCGRVQYLDPDETNPEQPDGTAPSIWDDIKKQLND